MMTTDKFSLINSILKKDEDKESDKLKGFWNAPVKKINDETRQLLEVLLKESRLSLQQQQHIRSSIKNGAWHLPLDVPRVNSGVEKKSCVRNAIKQHRGIRSRQSIVSSGCYERSPCSLIDSQFKDGSLEKERLQNLMMYGQEVSPENANDLVITPANKNEISKSNKEIINQLECEIEDRKRFLDEMKKRGMEKQYKPIILTEISQRKRKIVILASAS